jgi:hypothetical protein
MRITSIEKLMNSLSDGELLDIYLELEDGKVPSTSYAHDFCRKVNRMIDTGELSVKSEGFRHIYLPSLRKLVYKEMAIRYSEYLIYEKAPTKVYTPKKTLRCDNCGLSYDASGMHDTEYGIVCDKCYDVLVKPDED